ncbi:MAG: dihydrolipoyl dehydrogenase [Candidatus Poribacteria bacterium]|nr:MAG: dihydrolipoyl dehydrogenase [Candidatus Poribacteria bacterium]
MEATRVEIVVLGAGPGGYAAAFYAADRGHDVLLVDRGPRLGGVCLNEGCIPSKALLHAVHTLEEAKASAQRGIEFGEPRIHLDKLRAWKDSIIERLAGGIAGLARTRNVRVLQGRGYLEGSQLLRVETEEGQEYFQFEKAIIAVGSRPAMPPVFDLGNPRVMTSTEALSLPEIPDSLLVVGGGYIGMELGTVYAGLGSRVVVVEALPEILANADPDLSRPVKRRAESLFDQIRTGVRVTEMATEGKQIRVTMEVEGETLVELYDRVLVAVGRVPNTRRLGLENTKVQLDERGFIRVNERMQTDDPHLYAIGDVVGGAMLAHKAHREAFVAVEAIEGEASPREFVVPAVVFTDPEIAWCGLTEREAKEKGISVQVARFPWSASGRALTFDRQDGITKLILEPETDRVLGVGICGVGAGELIGEGVLAVEMGATALDLAEVVHPHPTLSETLMEAAEAHYGWATHRAETRRSRRQEGA